MKRVVVLLADGFEEVEAVTPIDFLRRAGCDVVVAGVTGDMVTGAHGIAVRSDVSVAECSGQFDAVVVPGGMPGASNVAASHQAIDLIDAVQAGGGIVAAICAAPAVVLAPNGFLDGKKATCYPGFEQNFGETVLSEDRVVVDGNLITSRGPGTAAEFALQLVRTLVSDAAADELHQGTIQK